MDTSTFDALREKLSQATWEVQNHASNTLKFTTKINGQRIDLYNTANWPMYINDLHADLTAGQIAAMLVFVDNLFNDSEAAINAETEAQSQALDDAIQTIIA